MRDPVAVMSMPDPMAKWTPVPDWRTVSLMRDGWSLKPVPGLGRTIVIGRIAEAIASIAPDCPMLGLWEIAQTPAFAIRMSRDKAMIVSPEPLGLTPGWNAGGWAVTPADSGYLAFELAGDELDAIIREATTTDVWAGSRSAAIVFAGVACLMVRTAPKTALLHVETGRDAYIWRWLETR